MADSYNNLIYSAVLFACSTKLWLVLANQNNKRKHILCADDVDSNLQMMNTMVVDSSAGIMSLSNDITFHLASYLDAKEMLSLALTCRQFGSKDDNKYGAYIDGTEGSVFHSHSLMDEAAVRQLSQNVTPQQMFVIPRSKGDTWLRLLSNPPKIKHWKLLNQCRATGKRTDRVFMMNAMNKKDIQFFHMASFGCPPDITDTLFDLFQNESLIVLSMEGPSPLREDADWGGSSGYYWDFTRSKLEKAKIFKDMLARIEQTFDIHVGIVSMRKLDWCYNDGQCMGTHRFIFTFGGGKKMLFTDGKKQTTLTLPHGSVMILSKDVGEGLVKKVPPPYSIQDPSTAEENATPMSDTNEGADAFFLMLDVSVRKEVREEIERRG